MKSRVFKRAREEANAASCKLLARLIVKACASLFLNCAWLIGIIRLTSTPDVCHIEQPNQGGRDSIHCLVKSERERERQSACSLLVTGLLHLPCIAKIPYLLPLCTRVQPYTLFIIRTANCVIFLSLSPCLFPLSSLFLLTTRSLIAPFVFALCVLWTASYFTGSN